MNDLLPRIRTPWPIGSMQLPHRIVMGSMHTGLEVSDDGGAGLAAFYRERVDGGAALIITGGLAVNSAGRGGSDYAVLGESGVRERLSRAVEAVRDAGGMIAAQLFHAGRYAILDGLTDATGRAEQAVAPSAVPWRAAHGAVPRALTADDIAATIADYADAALRALDAGFDAVEIMASEGYLINQFCSPLTNLRDDEWGGDSERRQRFALAVVRAVRSALPATVPVLVRMSGDDLMPGSTTPDEVTGLATALTDAGADALSVGIGWHESRVPTVQASVPHGAWLGYAERIAGAITESGVRRVPVIASNRITDLRQAESILQRGTVDAVALARPFLADARIIARSLGGDFDAVNTCIGCDQACIDRSLVFAPVSCLVNPRAGREAEFPAPTLPLLRAERQQRFAVVGSGPAGLAAAIDLAERGHAVTLFEAADELGGQFTLAARIPGKEDYARTAESARARLTALGADIRTGMRASVELLGDFAGVVVATGVLARRIELPGADLSHVLTYERALRDGVPDGSVAIIGGGGIGVDVATFLLEPHDRRERAVVFADRFELSESTGILADDEAPFAGPRVRTTPRAGGLVTLLKRNGRFGQGIGITSRWVALGALRVAGVRMLTDIAYREITPAGVVIENAHGSTELIPGKTVIVCAGQEPNATLAAQLREAGIRHEVVGGARDAMGVDAVRATSEGLAAARRLSVRRLP
ncbi:MAG TPA: FAD-dependent oxidoreductase [Microbacteriaceae bacterium]